MDLVISADCIKYPLTGIGRYTLELIKYARSEPTINLSAAAYGVERDQNELLSPPDQSAIASPSLRQRLWQKATLSVPRIAIAAERVLSRREARYIGQLNAPPLYHGTNYRLAEYDGPQIVTIHDLSAFKYPHWHPKDRVLRMERIMKRALGRASHILVDAESVKQELVETFALSKADITAIHLGVDTEYKPRTPEETSVTLKRHGLEHGRYLLFVSTIEPRKNIERLLEAYLALPRSVQQHYPLVLAGGTGWRSEHLHTLIMEAERAGSVRYLGYVSEREKTHLYSGAKAFVYPSIYEGFGLPLLEAMASGVPVITSNVSSMPEVAGDAALCVEPSDVNAIKEAMQFIVDDQQGVEALIKKGQERAKQFTWQTCAERTIALYQRFAPASE